MLSTFVLIKRPIGRRSRVLLLAWLLLLVGSSLFFHPAQANPSAQADVTATDPDSFLIDVYRDLAANDLLAAQLKVEAILQRYPNFRLAHLIRGDLLLMTARPVNTFGAATGAPQDKLKDLRDEAAARLRSLRERPNPNFVPRALLKLRDDQNFAFVVDARASRLYVYRHEAGAFKLIADYYASQGKLGVNKFKEGDQKTPLGVYHVTSRVAKEKLPEFYGSGALPINYPNDWDKLNGRGGSGIWLHGTPPDSYSRPPLASDGCVVLTNPDMEKLSRDVEIGKTPVVISDQVEFIDRDKWNAERNAAAALLEGWRGDWESMDPAQVMKNYSQKFKSGAGEDLNAWLIKNSLSVNGVKKISLKLHDVTLFRYPGPNEMILASFTQEVKLDEYKSSISKRQFWAKEGGKWLIVHEDNNNASGLVRPPPPVAAPVLMAKADTPRAVSVKDAPEQGDVMKAVNQWAHAWSSKDVKGYLSYYGNDFETPRKQDRKAWAEDRRARIEGKGRISVTIESPQVIVNGDQATVRFRQIYVSDRLSVSSRKTLLMTKQGERWKISQERSG